MAEQQKLSDAQLEAFYHDGFVEDQVRHFSRLLGPGGTVVDVGGGRGFFARRLAEAVGRKVRVLDSDPVAVAGCRENGVDGEIGDALAPRVAGDEEAVSFNLILHHLVGASERATRDLQSRALRAWKGKARDLFVNEYIYESFVGRASGRLIFWITKSRVLSWMGRAVAFFARSLRANTFGVGVRFRAHDEWRRLFEEAGFEVVAAELGAPEPVSLPRRLLLIKSIRRDSFHLRAKAATN